MLLYKFLYDSLILDAKVYKKNLSFILRFFDKCIFNTYRLV